MNSKLIIICVTVFIFVLYACNKDDGENPLQDKTAIPEIAEDSPVAQAAVRIPLTEEQQSYVGANNDFAFRLYREVMAAADSTTVSTFFSPLSVTYLLGMLAEGAEGQALEELTGVLGFGTDAQSVSGFCRTMIENAPLADNTVELNIANIFVLNTLSGLQLFRDYGDALQENYYSKIESLDFSQSCTVDSINLWCARQTRGMIPEIIEELDPTTVACLLNAVYFKAYWNNAFDEKETRELPFTLFDGTTVNRFFMHRKLSVPYMQQPDLLSAVSLPYGNGAYRMHILLPNEDRSIDDVLAWLTQNTWQQLIKDYPQTVDVLLPRFSAEFKVENMIQPLINMGVRQSFTNGLNRICMNANLALSKICQKAKIDVNERGAEASAITYTDIMWDVSPENETNRVISFHATRPFVYLITEQSTGAVFFIGTYTGL